MATAHGPQDELPDGNDVLLILQGIHKGRAVSEASKKLGTMIAAVTEYRKSGTLTIKLKVAPGRQDGTLDFTATSIASSPVEEHAGLFFVDENNQLHRDDPTVEAMWGRDEIENGAQG